jgi:hypothetical protein
MHVYFVGNQLKWCKFYSHPSRLDATHTERSGNTEFEWMWQPAGKLDYTLTTGPFKVPAMFYTSDNDDREELGDIIETGHSDRTDLGFYEIVDAAYGTYDRLGWEIEGDNRAVQFQPPFEYWELMPTPQPTVWKNKRFLRVDKKDLAYRKQLNAACAVPFFDRNAAYYGCFKAVNEHLQTTSTSKTMMSSPYIGLRNRSDETHGGYGPFEIYRYAYYPPEGQPDWPYWQFQDYADDGNWVPIGADVRSIVNMGPYTPWWLQEINTAHNVPPTATLNITLVNEMYPTGKIVKTEVRADSTAYLWEPKMIYLPSPDPESGMTQYIAEVMSYWGDAQLCVYMDDVDLAGGKIHVDGQMQGQNASTIFANAMPTFFGVIN